MGARGAYAGQPNHFACLKCKQSPAYRRDDGNLRPGVGTRFRTTGKVRPQRSEGGNRKNWPDHAYQYECLDCGHIGWSRHPRVDARYRKWHAADLDWDRLKQILFQKMTTRVITIQESKLLQDAEKRDPEMYRKALKEAEKW